MVRFRLFFRINYDLKREIWVLMGVDLEKIWLKRVGGLEWLSEIACYSLWIENLNQYLHGLKWQKSYLMGLPTEPLHNTGVLSAILPL